MIKIICFYENCSAFSFTSGCHVLLQVLPVFIYFLKLNSAYFLQLIFFIIGSNIFLFFCCFNVLIACFYKLFLPYWMRVFTTCSIFIECMFFTRVWLTLVWRFVDWTQLLTLPAAFLMPVVFNRTSFTHFGGNWHTE